jgi:hypothetical protein
MWVVTLNKIDFKSMPALLKNNSRVLSVLVAIAVIASITGCADTTEKTRIAATDTVHKKMMVAATDDSLHHTPAGVDGYKIFQSIKVQNVKRTLVIEVDKHVTGMVGKVSYDPQYHVSELQIESDTSTFGDDADTYNNAVLLLQDERGKILYRDTFERAYARIDTMLIEGKLMYLLTVDYSAIMGSYNGPVTWFFEVNDTGIRYLLHKKGFMHSLKSSWAIRCNTVPCEILSRSCNSNNANPDDDTFYTWYRKYRFKNGDWVLSSEKKVKEFWEDDGELSDFLKGF